MFAIYEAIELKAIYFVPVAELEAPFFSVWEKKWHDSGGKDINNPKIPLKFVIEKGRLVSGTTYVPPARAPRKSYRTRQDPGDLLDT